MEHQRGKLFTGLLLTLVTIPFGSTMKCFECDPNTGTICYDSLDPEKTVECSNYCVKMIFKDGPFKLVRYGCGDSKSEAAEFCTNFENLMEKTISLDKCGTCKTDLCNSAAFTPSVFKPQSIESKAGGFLPSTTILALCYAHRFIAHILFVGI